MNLTFSLSLFFVFFISSLLFHNSLSLIISLCHGGHILVWVWRGLLELVDDGL